MKNFTFLLFKVILALLPTTLSSQDTISTLIRACGDTEIKLEIFNNSKRLIYFDNKIGRKEVLSDGLGSQHRVLDAKVDSNTCIIIMYLYPKLVYYKVCIKVATGWKPISGGNIFWTFPSHRAIDGPHKVELLDIKHLRVTEGDETFIWEFDESYKRDQVKKIRQ